jgi:hypothetical protein
MAANCQATYNVNGEILNTTQLRERIMKVIGDKKLTIREIEQALGFEPKKLMSIMTGMSANHIVLMEKLNNNKRFAVYYNHPKSMLQNIFHPLPKSYENMKGKIYKETHAKHNERVRTPYETFNFSSMYNLAE